LDETDPALDDIASYRIFQGRNVNSFAMLDVVDDPSVTPLYG